jgi:DNA-binding NarL/FixJ family response regulator
MLDDNEIFDLIIIDANLQGVDGVSVLRNIKATRPKQKIAIISADDINAIENKACNQGALAIFSKPLNEDNITALIETANI